MSVLVLDENQIGAVLEDRRKRGADRWDEMWDGVLHMVPPPGSAHQSLTSFLNRVTMIVGPCGGRCWTR